MEEIINKNKQEMEKAVAAFKHELSKIRTGRASLSILDEVRVDYYGTLSPLNQVATLNTPDPRQITIQPWEAHLIPNIEKAIQKSGIGINPINDGKMIRLNMPSLNEERRKELVKSIKHLSEESRVGIRNHRRDSMEVLKKRHEAKELTDDDWRKAQDRIQKLTDEYIKKVDEMLAHKEKDILSI